MNRVVDLDLGFVRRAAANLSMLWFDIVKTAQGSAIT
jgi:hypothetical protein